MDYALNQISDEEIITGADTYSCYILCRRKAEYLMRLMFAVTTDLVLKHSSESVSDILTMVQDCTMGAMVRAAQILLNRIPRDQRGSEYEALASAWKAMLNDIRVSRNDDAHDGTVSEEMVNRFVSDNEIWFSELAQHTKNKYFSLGGAGEYIYQFVYVQNGRENGKHSCLLFPESGKPMRSGIQDAVLRRRQDPIYEGQLYLLVSQAGQLLSATAFYRLSPFIEFDLQSRSVLLYQSVLQSLSESVNLKYIYLTKDKRLEEYCLLSSLIPHQNSQNGYYRYVTSGRVREIEINLRDTNHPGTVHLATHNSAYCDAICPEQKKILECCDKRQYRYCLISGEGGLGKTAAILHLINDHILTGNTDYKRVIFLSAKRHYPIYDRSLEEIQNGNATEAEIQPDFTSYHDFLRQMYQLILSVSPKPGMEDTQLKAKCLDKIQKGSVPSHTLLVIDDLDSLPVQDQEKIIAFINDIPSHRIFAILTTRSPYTSGYRIALNRLDADDCLTFLNWYLEYRRPGSSREFGYDGNLLLSITQGRPYDLQHLANLLLISVRRLDPMELSGVFHQLLTPTQRTFYLCRTSLYQLTPSEQMLFHFLCHANTALCKLPPEEESNRQEDGKPARILIPVCLLRYLQLNGLEDDDALKGALRKLRDVCLLEADSQADTTVMVRRELSYTRLLQAVENLPDLPEYLCALLARMETASDPAPWSDPNRIPTVLLPYLLNRLHSLDTIDPRTTYELRMLEPLALDHSRGCFSQTQGDLFEAVQREAERKTVFAAVPPEEAPERPAPAAPVEILTPPAPEEAPDTAPIPRQQSLSETPEQLRLRTEALLREADPHCKETMYQELMPTLNRLYACAETELEKQEIHRLRRIIRDSLY